MDSKRILFNFASRSRPDKFAAVCTFINTHCKPPFTIWAKVDIDDPCYDQYMQIEDVMFNIGTSRNKVHAINRGLPSDGWDILVNVSDDIVFTDPAFADIIRAYCEPDDFLLFPEPFADGQVIKGKNERIAIMSVIGNAYYNRDGYVYHPDYKSLFCDNEATTVARERGCLKEVEAKIFYHAHPSAGYKTNDAQYKRTEAFWNEDKATYYRRNPV